MSYDALSDKFRGYGEQRAADAREAIRAAEEGGQLPADLAAILLRLLPAKSARDGDETGIRAEELDPEAMFDEPTVPMLKKAAEPPAANAPVGAFLPPLPAAAATPAASLPDYSEARSRLDDAVLSSLIGDFRGLREGRDLMGRSEPKADALDGLLVNYRSARFRSDARRASQGEAPRGLKLARLDDFHGRRAGVGSILRDRFILDREIGRGGMGVVYAAVDRRRLEAASGSPYVALKLLSDEFRSNPEALRTFEAEARKSQSLAHPNIATVYDFDRDGAEVFIVMELLTGMPLSRLLGTMTGQPLPAMQVASILRGICAGLAHAHRQGVVHSDLKPGNVFVSETDTVKLLDFGLATAAQASHAFGLDGLTAAYASPEMFDGAPRDPRDDIFALGCIAYQLLTGLHPFGMQPIDEAMKAGRKPEPIGELDPAAWVAIEGSLAFEREARVATVEAFIAGLFEG